MDLVAGASAPVGRHLAEVLGSQGSVRCWEGIGDLDAAMQGVSVVYFCIPVADPTLRVRSHPAPSLHLGVVHQAARAAGVRRVVYLSTSRVFGLPLDGAFTESSPARPSGTLGRLARQDEAWLLRQAGSPEILVLRCGQLFGSGEPITDSLLGYVRARQLWLPSHGQASQTFMHPADAARALVAAAVRGRAGGVYLAGGFTSTWRELCEELAVRHGLALQIRSMPREAAYALAALRELTTPAGRHCWPSRQLVDTFAQRHLLDDSLSRRELTWSPLVGSFEEAGADLARSAPPAGAPQPVQPVQPVQPAQREVASPIRLRKSAPSARRGRSRS